MQTHVRKLVVILAEAALEPLLVDDALRLGAHGYTIVDARGGGTGGPREALWDADRCIHMQVICDEHTADALAEHLQQSYFEHYAINLYVCDVGVLRPAKFDA